MSPILDAFQDLRLEKLSAYASKWVEGPYDPRKRGPAWSVPIKSISLYKPIPSRGPGGYIVVLELVENEHSLTYQAAKDAEWEYRSPIPMPNGFDALSKDEQDIVRHHLDDVGMTRTGKTLSAEHSEINKLTTACAIGCTIIDYSQLIDKDFVRLVYRPEVVAASGEKALRDEWRFHVLFPDEHIPEWIDEEGPFIQLYPRSEWGQEKETKAIDTKPLEYALLPEGEHWRLIWAGKSTTHKSDGWKYIHYCMQYPGKSFSYIELEEKLNLMKVSPDSINKNDGQLSEMAVGKLNTLIKEQRILDTKAKNQIDKYKEDLIEEIEEAKESGQSDRALELREKLEGLEQATKNCIWNQKTKSFTDLRMTVKAKVNQAIDRAIKKLDGEALKHFQSAFPHPHTTKKSYKPIEAIPWKLK